MEPKVALILNLKYLSLKMTKLEGGGGAKLVFNLLLKYIKHSN